MANGEGIRAVLVLETGRDCVVLKTLTHIA
jgi:hypothetical protein